MSEQQPGLRFDIYERVHLQEDLAGIQELNDVELLPHIQVITLDDQAILKGNLLLTGNYFSEERDAPRSLEHLIPVEITLPLNRIHRVEDIQVEIENFDIDLLSARSLNVTGVLSLQGVEIVSAPLESWREEEEVTFVHEVNIPRFEPAVPYTPQFVQEPPTLPIIQEPVNVSSYAAPPPYEAPAQDEVASEFGSNDGAVVVEIEQTELKVTPHQESTVVTEDKKELKVAFGKKANEAVDINPYGIKSLLSKAGSYLTDKRNAEAEAQAALAEETRIDAVEWKRLFLQSNTGSQEFRKLKLCIVQKEDTLESIAKRYQLNPRELQLLNRMSDQEISVGQVIYLPR
ncbi:LysM peptidoglycan-binding domain-containing protein [Paenibacillus alginolyticus]|uniref:LysM peptidoglycan-binding domain-containing protein n=1 Tax=Paenibacillus alginolyticus TaxID=59839 RepID=A0ABT4GDL5_9BACL|nr:MULTISPECIES: LysM peptidoglycan-binding domain-containing protein [Paenibacillus]MCY9663777.1 LysM peptidoglycan-binding domain-containing protein [Paenibacillus alginolyticus]MCY9694288.1 LysM peptidoglycan-binding domain-containing protein [Paenibacillus alginolyticus]MEC0142838.1 LysM peptidoglycan-binding domain-containing protein [Paenibacillus alginolyticus]NRF91444.1 LysM peptidoglycan-binding domain-containing protein [Paenibacillus frigoriresistens]